MNKPKKKNANAPAKTIQAPLPTALPPKENVSETDEERQARCDRANKTIREALTAENCTLMVPTLDISSGRVFPQIQVVALQAK